MRVLTYTTLFPNPREPRHGLFVAERWRHLLASGQVEGQVMAPVPWFPSTHPRFGRYADKAGVPRVETREGRTVHHPRYPVIPKVGMTLAPALLAMATVGPLRRLLHGAFPFDLIDAHYLYPDGVAAVMLGAWLGKPVALTARGSDVTQIADYPLPRRMLRWAVTRATGVVAVSSALADAVAALGIPRERVRVLRNGVDLERFRPLERAACREELGLTRPTLLSVGHLIERKGHHLIVAALPRLPGVDLLIVGAGEMAGELQELAQRSGVAERVRLVGIVAPEKLPLYYTAADALVLASSREGWANVLLEAMACGAPVVATAVWGAPEAVTTPEAGVLITERSPEGVARGVARLLQAPPSRQATRRHAEGFSWAETTQGQLDLFNTIISS